MELVVARIARAHGLRGEVALEVRTDEPAERLAVGAILRTDPPEAGPLRVTGLRRHSGRFLVRFAEASDRTAAEALRGVELLVDVEGSDEPEAWYPHELAGLEVRHVDGRVLGVVDGVEHLPAQDAIVLRESGGGRTLVPFVAAIVPVVDVEGGFLVLDPPGGLLASDAEHLEVARGDE